MWHKVLITGTLATSLVWLGCARPLASTAGEANYTSVSVRFVNAPPLQRFAETDAQSQGQLVVDTSYDGFAADPMTGEAAMPTAEPVHVALWGGPFAGQNVTHGVTALTPGTYTAAFFDRERDTMIQGWFDVHATGDDILDVLYKWKNGIPDQKKRFAYDFEVRRNPDRGDPAVLESFTKQLRAFDRLEKQIDAAIQEELQARARRETRLRDFLANSDILIMPGGGPVFHSATEPAFSNDDLADIHGGGALTKILLAADFQDAQWKLRHVNRLYGDLVRCKAVFREEAGRLERRKGLFLLTDHLYRHDQRFVENEAWLQSTLGAIDRLDRQMGDLRERRMALAFMTELIAPEGTFAALDREQQEWQRERAVLETEARRLDLLIGKAAEDSPRRVALERNRQRTAADIGALDRHLGQLAEARTTLAAMADSTQVIHRQGDTRLLTATLVDRNFPFNIRNAVERESVMTVRLEAGDNVYVPTMTNATTTEVPTPPMRAYTTAWTPQPVQKTHARRPTYTPPKTPVKPVFHSRAHQRPQEEPRQVTQRVAFPKPHSHSAAQTIKHRKHVVKPNTRAHMIPQRFERTKTRAVDRRPSGFADSTRTIELETYEVHPVTLADTTPRPARPSNTYRADRRPSYSDTVTGRRDTNVHLAHQPAVDRRPYKTAKVRDRVTQDDGDCPLWAKLLVPPCWFAEKDGDKGVTEKTRRTKDARLARHPEQDRAWQKKGTIQRSDQKDDDCPFLIKLLVPPCWLTEKNCDRGTTAKTENTTDVQLARHQEKERGWQKKDKIQRRDQKDDDCPLLLKLLVPPCWLANKHRDQGTTAETRKTTEVRLADYPEADRPRTRVKSKCDEQTEEGSECPWLIRLLVPPCWLAD